MIDEQSAPVNWYLLMCELADAQEGINSLLNDMQEDKDFCEIGFAIHMRHIYGHINRAWNRRNATDKQSEDEKLWGEWSKSPADLDSPF